MGLLAWLVEKFREWSDCGGGQGGQGAHGHVETAHSKDALLTNAMIYWVSGCIGPSMRLYYESLHGMPGTPTEVGELSAHFVTVPVGVASFPQDIFVPPRAWCERAYNVCRFTVFPSGGHFAALERPVELVAAISTQTQPKVEHTLIQTHLNLNTVLGF